MKIKRKIFYFNIVEVALALAIVGIGIAGIMALFPVALNASRDAIGDNNAPDVAEQMLTYIEAKANAENDTDWSAGANFIDKLASAKPSDTDTLVSEVDDSSPIAGTNLYSSITPGLFRAVQKTTTASGDIVDFSAIIRVWKQQIPKFNIEGTDKGSISLKYGADIFVEVSWPAERPYGQREKRVYVLELFNPNAN